MLKQFYDEKYKKTKTLEGKLNCKQRVIIVGFCCRTDKLLMEK